MTRLTYSPHSAERTLFRTLCVALGLFVLSACSTAVPEGMAAVSPFDLARYQGQWFEVARLDHSFERGLSNVSATYSPQPDGSVRVLNRGYNREKGAWKEAVGRAVFTGDAKVASLKVSFFGPFYGGYHVIALDEQNYRWAMVVGPDRDYLWMLSRDKQLTPDLRALLLAKARALGIAVDALIWVDQSREAE